MTTQVYQFAGGYGVVAVPNAPINSPRNPISGQDLVSPNGNAYQLGQFWRNSTTGNAFQYVGGGVWAAVNQSPGAPIDTITGNVGVVSPTAGNVNIVGTGGLTFTGSGSTLTGTINPGSNFVSTITASTGGALSPTLGNISILGTANQVTTSGLSSTVTLSLPVTIVGPGSIAATTSLTATLGNITATNGNLVLGTAGNRIVSTSVASGTLAGANSFGTVALVGGTATVSTSAVDLTSIIFITVQSLGTVAAPVAVSVTAKTPNTSFVITSSDATDTSTVGWMIVN